MVVFDNLEEIFQRWRDFSEYSRALVTLATATGTLVVLLYSLKFLLSTYQGLRLYVCSQFCCKTNFLKKYGQWAVISGATDGIGLAMARELAKRGHSIVVIGRNEEKLARSKALIEEEPNVGQVVTIKIDLSDSSLENFEKIRDQLDPENRDIGILINNAGVFYSTLMRYYNFDMDKIRNLINVNILATLYLTRMVLPGMVARGRGLVLNVSSAFGSIPGPYVGVYAPSKTFIDTFSRQLQIEYSSYPIDIINLTPGAVHTKLFTETSTIDKPSILNPTPEDYARITLNAVSTRYPSISGTWFHGFSLIVARFSDTLGLLPILYKVNLLLNARDARLSPSPRRRATARATGDK